MRKDFILDFETIGSDAKVIPVINCAYTTFEWDRFESDNPYSFQELVATMQKSKLDIKDQMQNHGCKYTSEDLQWWLDKPAQLRADLKPSEDDLKPNQFIAKLLDYLLSANKISYWWSRSNTFDPIILDRMAEISNKKNQLSAYLPYWKVRDTRTYIDAKFNFPGNNGFCPFPDEEKWEVTFNAHDAKHDVAADIMRLQAIVRAELDMELPNG